jgi:hypothetical protein
MRFTLAAWLGSRALVASTSERATRGSAPAPRAARSAAASSAQMRPRPKTNRSPLILCGGAGAATLPSSKPRRTPTMRGTPPARTIAAETGVRVSGPVRRLTASAARRQRTAAAVTGRAAMVGPPAAAGRCISAVRAGTTSGSAARARSAAPSLACEAVDSAFTAALLTAGAADRSRRAALRRPPAATKASTPGGVMHRTSCRLKGGDQGAVGEVAPAQQTHHCARDARVRRGDPLSGPAGRAAAAVRNRVPDGRGGPSSVLGARASAERHEPVQLGGARAAPAGARAAPAGRASPCTAPPHAPPRQLGGDRVRGRGHPACSGGPPGGNWAEIRRSKLEIDHEKTSSNARTAVLNRVGTLQGTQYADAGGAAPAVAPPRPAQLART